MGDDRSCESAGQDIARLRAEHPAWAIEAAWTSRASGPDVRQVAARREGVELRARTGAELSAKIIAVEAARGWPAS